MFLLFFRVTKSDSDYGDLVINSNELLENLIFVINSKILSSVI